MARSTPCCGVHYAWVVAVVIFIALLMAGGIRSVPGVVTVALETEYGWSRALISGAVSVNILLYGLVGPFAAAVMEALGIRKSVMAALALLALGTGLTPLMKDAWHLYILWGVLVGWAAGVVAPTLGKVVANRWFASHTGLVMGVFAASSSTGQVAFAPLLGAIVEAHGWRPAALLMAAVAVAMLPMMWFFMVDKPGDIGSAPYGAVPLDETAAEAADAVAADVKTSSVAEARAEAPDAAGNGVEVAAVGAVVATEADGSGERIGSGVTVVVPVTAERTEADTDVTDTALRIATPPTRHAVHIEHAPGLELVQSGGAGSQAAGLASPVQGVSVNPITAETLVCHESDVATQAAVDSSIGAVAVPTSTPSPPAHISSDACAAPEAAESTSGDVAVTLAVPFASSTSSALEPPPAAVAGDAVATSRWTPFLLPLRRLREAAALPDFWLLAGSFFVCGASTNGLIATHIIPACQDHGMAETAASGFLAGIGVFDIAGTIASGWLTDRYDSRVLLCAYYGLRGVALILLPWAFDLSFAGLWPFAVVYGLDWIATVPPTARLCTDCFGKERSAVLFGWCLAAHQVGAAIAAAGAGAVRTVQGTYSYAFWFSGALCVVTSLAVLAIGRWQRPAQQPQLQAHPPQSEKLTAMPVVSAAPTTE